MMFDYQRPTKGHVIQHTRVESSDMMSMDVTSGTTYTISGLVASVHYSVIVASVNDYGTGPFSKPVIDDRGTMVSVITQQIQSCTYVCI